MEKEIKKQIIAWLKSDQDYSSGLALLIQVCKNRVLVRNLSRNSTPKNTAKIAAELRKAAGMSSFMRTAADHKKKESDGLDQTPSTKAGKAFKEAFKTYPPIIQRLIKRIGDLYSQREILHFDIKEVPELNTAENTNKRKVILEKIILISEELEHLNKFKARFFKDKSLPDEQDLNFKPKKPSRNPKPKDNIAKLSEAQLVRKLNNLRTSLTKKRNKLTFQHVSKQQKENPMPEGIKREKLISQIKDDERSILKIQKRLDDFAENK
jgi:hypothetical protein